MVLEGWENTEKTSIMTYNDYLKEIEERKAQGLHPKPIDEAELITEIIMQIKDASNPNREDSLKFFIYNTLPGTTAAAGVKAQFLKEIILGESVVSEISIDFCFRATIAHERWTFNKSVA